MVLKKEYLTKEMVYELGKVDDYYTEERWLHYSEVLNHLKKIENIDNVLEIGPYKTPFISGSDIMDIEDYHSSYPFEANKVILHNCSDTPFPVENKTYDLIIACQVLEHLGNYGQQKAVFDEFERISHKALITLPYDWNVPNFRTHHRIDERVFDNWASWRQYDLQEIHGEGPYKRILRIYSFK